MQKNMPRYLAIVVVIVTITLPIILVDVYAPKDRITPDTGRVGQHVNVHGDGFKLCPSNVVVKFGQAGSETPIPSTVRNDKLVQFRVPEALLGPNNVIVECEATEILTGIFSVIP